MCVCAASSPSLVFSNLHVKEKPEKPEWEEIMKHNILHTNKRGFKGNQVGNFKWFPNSRAPFSVFRFSPGAVFTFAKTFEIQTALKYFSSVYLRFTLLLPHLPFCHLVPFNLDSLWSSEGPQNKGSGAVSVGVAVNFPRLLPRCRVDFTPLGKAKNKSRKMGKIPWVAKTLPLPMAAQ